MKTPRIIRYRLYPGTYQKHRQLHGTAGACRYVWNHFVAKLKDEYEYYGESRFNFFTLGKQFTTLRKHCDQWLQGYSAYIIKSSLQPIEIAYKGFFKGNNGLPKFHGKYRHSPSFPINYQTAGMTKSAKRTIKTPGKHVKAKSGLNREILKSGWYKPEHCLSYKTYVGKVNEASKR